MADPKDGEEPGSEASAPVNNGELPTADAPPLSPASEQPQPALETPAAAPTAAAAVAPPKRLYLKPQHKRQALAAAAVALVAGFGAVVGALAGSALAPPPKRDIAGLEERTAMQQSIAHLSKQVALLKTDLAKANKAAHAQIASVSERLDAAHAQMANISARLDATAKPEITGSIPQAPQAAPVPIPRRAPRVAATESRLAVVRGWSVRGARDGFVYVQSHGDIYQVVLGAPLPGLGPVQAIRHQDGHWVVVTPRGIIVSLRDRQYFK
jgi:uncharacterized coiled-coil protein SlyX